MSYFEEKIVAQNEQILKNQETIIEMLRYAPFIQFGDKNNVYLFMKPFLKFLDFSEDEINEHLKDFIPKQIKYKRSAGYGKFNY